jgi:hypothetical protein
VRRTVPSSAEIEAQIDRLLTVGVGENPRESLSELDRAGYTAAANCLADDLDALRRAPALPDQTPPQVAKHEPARKVARRGQAAHQGDRPLPRRDQLPHARLGRA